MFEVGFTEIVLIFGIALLVLGPARLPKLAADLGRWAGRARSMARQLRTQLEQEVHFDPLATAPSKSPTPPASPTTPPPPPAPAAEARALPMQAATDGPALPADEATTAHPTSVPIEPAAAAATDSGPPRQDSH
jgi:sec-independent protein translocase protein TatB